MLLGEKMARSYFIRKITSTTTFIALIALFSILNCKNESKTDIDVGKSDVDVVDSIMKEREAEKNYGRSLSETTKDITEIMKFYRWMVDSTFAYDVRIDISMDIYSHAKQDLQSLEALHPPELYKEVHNSFINGYKQLVEGSRLLIVGYRTQDSKSIQEATAKRDSIIDHFTTALVLRIQIESEEKRVE
jgi:hypothetical protein